MHMFGSEHWWSTGPYKHIGSSKQKQGLVRCGNGGRATSGQPVQPLLHVWVRWGFSGHMLVQVFLYACPVEAESHGCIVGGDPSRCWVSFQPSDIHPAPCSSAEQGPCLAVHSGHCFGQLIKVESWTGSFPPFCPGVGADPRCMKIIKHLALIDCIGHQVPKYTHGPGQLPKAIQRGQQHPWVLYDLNYFQIGCKINMLTHRK